MTDTSFITYLQRRLVAEEGFTEGTVPEAEELLAASSAVLTWTDGYGFVVVCLVDREQDAARRFPLDVAALKRVGEACQKYTGTVNGTKLPLSLHVIEVGAGPLSPEDRARLEGYRAGLFSKVHLSTTYLDTVAREAWSNHRVRRTKPSTGLLRKMLQEPQREVVSEEQALFPPDRPPVLTFTLLGLLVLCFGAEHLFAVGGEGHGLLAPGLPTLWGLGGLNRGAVLEDGQWWRLLTSPLLHGDVFHLVLNGVCLFFAGSVLEVLVGRAWLGFVLVLSSLGGGLLSMAFNPDIVSVGASDAIMGLLAALLVLSWRMPQSAERTELRMQSMRLLLPALLPLATSRSGGTVDIAAHVGGALVGGALGWLLVRTWPRQEEQPPFRRLAGGVGVLAALALVGSSGLVAEAHEAETLQAQVVPPEELPEDVSPVLADLLVRYPRDPRLRLYQAVDLLRAEDAAGSERELRTALAEERILALFFSKGVLPQRLHVLLAYSLLKQGREAEAREVLQPFCHTDAEDALLVDLQEKGLCGGGIVGPVRDPVTTGR